MGNTRHTDDMDEKQTNRVGKVQDPEAPDDTESVGGEQGGKWRSRVNTCVSTTGSLQFSLLHLEEMGYLSFGETELEGLRTLDIRHRG